MTMFKGLFVLLHGMPLGLVGSVWCWCLHIKYQGWPRYLWRWEKTDLQFFSWGCYPKVTLDQDDGFCFIYLSRDGKSILVWMSSADLRKTGYSSLAWWSLSVVLLVHGKAYPPPVSTMCMLLYHSWPVEPKTMHFVNSTRSTRLNFLFSKIWSEVRFGWLPARMLVEHVSLLQWCSILVPMPWGAHSYS